MQPQLPLPNPRRSGYSTCGVASLGLAFIAIAWISIALFLYRDATRPDSSHFGVPMLDWLSWMLFLGASIPAAVGTLLGLLAFRRRFEKRLVSAFALTLNLLLLLPTGYFVLSYISHNP